MTCVSHAEHHERHHAVHLADHPGEVHAEEPDDPGERHEDRRHDREPLHDLVEPVGDRREVDVHRPGQQVAVAVDEVADADQVVVDVAEVPLRVRRHAGDLDDAGDDAGERVPLRADHLAPADQPALEAEQLLQLLVVGPLQHAVLEVVDAVVELGEAGEEAVGQHVDDHVQEHHALGRRLRLGGRPLAQVVERRAAVAVDGDEVRAAEEAVHLDETVLVLVGAVDDEVARTRRRGRTWAAGRSGSASSTASGWNLNTSESRARSSVVGLCRSSQKNSPDSRCSAISGGVDRVVGAVRVHHERRGLGTLLRHRRLLRRCVGDRRPPVVPASPHHSRRGRRFLGRALAGVRRVQGVSCILPCATRGSLRAPHPAPSGRSTGSIT